MSKRARSQMAREISQIPDIAARQCGYRAPLYIKEGERLRKFAPRFFVTCARGSSDHAAAYFKFLAESRLGIPVASVPPSIGSLYRQELRLENAACLTISQSGESPDLAQLQRNARIGGARTIAVLNATCSPLSEDADCVLPLLAGSEVAVPATKSFVASLVAVAFLVASLANDKFLLEALRRLPDALRDALAYEWPVALEAIPDVPSLFTVSRGPGLAIAQEAALKFKETCRLHAEAFSAAELQHGPVVLARSRFAAFVFAQLDESRPSILHAADVMEQRGAEVFLVESGQRTAGGLRTAEAPHPLLVPICQITTFYAFVERLATRIGVDPDAPSRLKKVTRTR